MLNLMSLNQRVNALSSQINNIIPTIPQALNAVLTNGNNAGSNDIDMNGQDILSVANIDVTTINGTPYPPVVASDTLQDVLTAGDTSDLSIILVDDLTTTTKQNTITATDITLNDITSGNTTTFSNGLITTAVQFDINSGDNIGLDASVSLIANATDEIQLNVLNNNITLNSVNAQFVSNTTGFSVNASDFIQLTANNDYIFLQADDDLTLFSPGLGNINLDAPNVNSYNWAMPISFSQFETGIWSYTTGGQVFQNVYSVNVPLPVEFFALNPQSGSYTSSRWELSFDMNCWNFANAGDKGFAIYLSFLDNIGNLYEPIIYNSTTPFCKWDMPPTYAGTLGQFKSVNFCDRIDLGALQNSNDSNLLLQMNIAGDLPFNFVDFKFKVGFSRVNRIN